MEDLNTDLINFSSLVGEDEWKLHIHYNLIRITEMKLISRQKFSNCDKPDSRTKVKLYFVFLILGVNKNRISEKKQENITYI